MKPTIGRIVIVSLPHASNGASDAPAIITRVWNDGVINVCAFPDYGQPIPLSSVMLRDTRDEAMVSGYSLTAWWPPREDAPVAKKEPAKELEPVKPSTLGAQPTLPRYRCHKEVGAAQIIRVSQGETVTAETERVGGTWLLKLRMQDRVAGSAIVEVTHDWYTKHNPQEGGYYVVYADGYASFSPIKAFENGYSRVVE